MILEEVIWTTLWILSTWAALQFPWELDCWEEKSNPTFCEKGATFTGKGKFSFFVKAAQARLLKHPYLDSSLPIWTYREGEFLGKDTLQMVEKGYLAPAIGSMPMRVLNLFPPLLSTSR